MANEEHVRLLKQGIVGWNTWRRNNPERRPDLSEAALSEADLSGVNLCGANLRGANLRGADLSGARLSRARLSRADLSGADLRGADLRGADLRGADLSGADLSGIELDGAVLGYTHFAHQDLTDMRHIEIIRCYAPSYIDLMTVTLPPMSSALATFLGGTVQSPYLIEALQGTILPLADVPVNIFLSYIESDREFAAGLRPHLELLNSVRLIEEPIPLACQELWQRNVEGCENAHLMVLLISAPFLASPIVKEQILEPGLQHLKKGKLLVPVIVRPVNWQESPLQGLQSLPIQGLPVSRWSDRDDALHTIAQDLQSLVRELYKKLLEEASRQRQRDLLLAQLIQTRTTSAEERRKLSTAQTQIREASKAVADAAKHLQEAQKNLQEAQEMLQTYTQQEQELQQRVTTMQQTETDLLAHIKELKLTPDGETSG